MAKKKRHIRKSILYVLILAALIILGLLVRSIFFPAKEKETEPSPTPEPTQETTPTPEPTPTPTPDPETDARFSDTDSLLVFANKSHPLPEGYEPSDLTQPDVEMRYNVWTMRQEASEALEDMFAAAREEGIYLVMGSGYRSPDFQKYLYDNYVANYGVEAADTFSSRPGYSDHQTGLATDLCGQDTTYDLDVTFIDTPEGQWLFNHAWEYGFVMRYPEGKDEITGYMYEPWHYRYIGKDYAKQIHEAGPDMTMEEFFGIRGGDYAD